MFPKEMRRRAMDILAEGKSAYQLQLFADVEHGFALRADLSNPWQRYAKEASFQGVLDWFDQWTR